MFHASWREKTWKEIEGPWDLLVVGGGINGAAVLHDAGQAGLRCLLLEARDFAWGASSRSSKLVHGGLRYLAQGDIKLTYEAVRERERLLQEAPGLVERTNFLVPHYRKGHPGRALMGVGLSLYDIMAGTWKHRYYGADFFQTLAPGIKLSGLVGGYWFQDAVTDDARLVLRLILEAMAEGQQALNYVQCVGLLKEDGEVRGALVQDVPTGRTAHVAASVVVNATGAEADFLRGEVGAPKRLRPLRGSHLVFPAWRLPVPQAVSFPHPRDHRPIFLSPWEGVVLLGTTDEDHGQSMDRDPAISAGEAVYLLEGLRSQFPSLDLSFSDVRATFAGVRPVIGSGKTSPSDERRDFAVWDEHGLLTATGGKLTTFRLMSSEVLKAVRRRLPGCKSAGRTRSIFKTPDLCWPKATELLPAAELLRLAGRYGLGLPGLLAAAGADEWKHVADTPTLWAELRWAARAEAVMHLDDLMLRRTRLGLVLPQGGAEYMGKIGALCQEELGWDPPRWEEENDRYRRLWESFYSLPHGVAGPGQRGASRSVAVR
jgi:glycerol-3-phosphate dehydrogenase